MASRLTPFNAASVRTPPGYSHAVRAGDLIFVSGQVPLDEDGAVVGMADMAAQARQAFRNLGAVLAEAGASYSDIVKLTYFLCDIDQIAAVREARNEFIDLANPPASSLVEVSRLFMPGILIEIEAVALAPR